MGTSIGIGNYIGNNQRGIGKKPFDPSKLEYQALWVANGKTNEDVDKNIPNLADPSNPLIVSNFLWNEISGYMINGLIFDGIDDTVMSKVTIPILNKYTIVGDVEFLKIEANGFYKSVSWSWYGGTIYLPGSSYNAQNVIGFNNENLIVTKNLSIPINLANGDSIVTTVGTRRAGANGNFPQINFRSLAIISSILDEKQIRSVYQYIKTLKANNIG